MLANDTVPGAPDPATLYRSYNLSVPVDHFRNDSMYAPHSNGTSPLRYWYDDRFYKPGGPVIALAASETSGAGRTTAELPPQAGEGGPEFRGRCGLLMPQYDSL
ncbi:putative extracellular serine carboxypeptidase [Colletotrichum tanaceti]|nr:putative extracellular serine carboxypeptidase [Colletotrichum tanaceti]